jgi:hypothetical protein
VIDHKVAATLLAGITAFLTVGAITQMDYNTQIKNKPVTVVAITGTNTLAAAITSVGAGGYVVLQSGNYVLTSTVTASHFVNFSCQPGAVIQAGANFSALLTVASSGVTVSGCGFDGRYSQGNYTTSAIGGTNITNRTVTYSTLNKFYDSGIAINGCTACLFSHSQYTNFGRNSSAPRKAANKESPKNVAFGPGPLNQNLASWMFERSNAKASRFRRMRTRATWNARTSGCSLTSKGCGGKFPIKTLARRARWAAASMRSAE